MGQNSADGPVHILIVDDDPDIRDIFKYGIQHSGYACLTANGANEALEILHQQHVDVVVSDINMPEMNGLELIKVIKERHDCDVIIMTGYIEDFTYEEIIGRGASDFIQKPVRISEFIARLKRVLFERETLAERDKAAESLRLNLEKFQRAMDGIIHAISLTVELRDPYTAGHQQRVSDLAAAIARDMGLSADRIYGLRMASNIHDLGKITIPSEILCKPGHLGPLEYELIKNHVQAGYDILKKIEFPWPLAEIILQHHERMDGSGYPHALQGEQILLEARILAVADVFETMSSHRPYRPSLGQDRAIDELFQNKGRLYDAVVAETCLNLIIEKRFSFEGKRGSFEGAGDRAGLKQQLFPN
ncbi:MAG: response regulator [Deltaproteobacteria bacterium]|nr:response regulator [Deltaproteobacteria bacterium]